MAKQTHQIKRSALFLVATVLVAALVSVTTSVQTNESLERYVEQLRSDMQLVQLAQTKPPELPGTYEEALEGIRQRAWSVVVPIERIAAPTSVSTQWQSVQVTQAVGVFVTSDGWILADASVLDGVTNATTQLQIRFQGNVSPITQIQEDTRTGLVMVKADIEDTPSVPFGASADMLGGELVFNIPAQESVIATSLKSANIWASVALPAEVAWQTWALQETGAEQGPLFNAAAELVAVGTETGVIPMHYAVPFVQQVLQEQQNAAGLGIELVQREHVQNADWEEGQETGVLVTNVLRTGAVYGSIQVGDVLTQINGRTIETVQQLALQLAGHQPEDTITIQVERDGEQEEFTVELTVLEELVY